MNKTITTNDLDGLINRLQLYQNWRRGHTDEWHNDPTLLGKDIDDAIGVCKIVNGDKAVNEPIKDGGGAFPTPTGVQHNDGMTIRDYFAAAALPVTGKAYEYFVANGDNPNEEVANAAYEIADAMLKARAAKP